MFTLLRRLATFLYFFWNLCLRLNRMNYENGNGSCTFFKILAALEFNYLIIFQYNTKIDKILLLRNLEKTIIYVVLLQKIIIRTHLVFYNLIITFYILTSRSGFFETESLF